MIATHNVKVNGRWYFPGQEIPETTQQISMPLETGTAAEPEATPAAEAPAAESPAAETKPKTTSRRSKASK